MYKVYFKQSLRLLRQNPVMSLVAITGTALAIMMIMTIIISEEMKSIPVAPEINRKRTFYIDYSFTTNRSGPLEYKIYRDYLSELQTPEAISIISYQIDWKRDIPIQVLSTQKLTKAIVRGTDHIFWQIYSFSFLEGRGFTEEHFYSGVKEAVVNKSMARQLFNGRSAIDQEINILGENYRIVGIVKDFPALFKDAYSEIWVPYSCSPDTWNSFCAIFLLQNKKEYPTLYKEVRLAEKRYQTENPSDSIYLKGPENHFLHRMNIQESSEKKVLQTVHTRQRKKIVLLLLILLIPAINLSELSISRLKKRMEEIGVRKAFGAKKQTILIQVLFENLITSLLGSGIGLILSYIAIFSMRHWLLGIPGDHSIPLNTLISFPVVGAVCIICILINLLSAGIPVWKAIHIPVIHSIN